MSLLKVGNNGHCEVFRDPYALSLRWSVKVKCDAVTSRRACSSMHAAGRPAGAAGGARRGAECTAVPWPLKVDPSNWEAKKGNIV